MRRIHLTALIALAGCATDMGVPRPTIDLPPSQLSLALAFGPGVPPLLSRESDRDGTFHAPTGESEDRPSIHWRDFLTWGFAQGIRPFFQVPDPRGADELLIIEQAELSAVAVNRAGVAFTIRFRARLANQSGEIVRRSFGTVSGIPGEDPAAALDRMYETIARDLFAER